MQCPKCNARIEEQATKCHACGYVLPSSTDQTLDPSRFFESTDDLSGGEVGEPIADTDASEEDRRPQAGGESSPASQGDLDGTLQLPELSPPGQLPSTDSTGDELDEAHPTDADSDAAATMDLSADSPTGQSADFDLQMTLPLPEGEGQGVQPSDATIDFLKREKTLSEGQQEISGADATVEYDSFDAPGSNEDSRSGSGSSASGSAGGRTGSAGRLNRIWQGAGGSGSNPMHTLKGGGAMASDSIFERVAKRILVSEAIQTIIESGVRKVGDRESVSKCIATACQGVDRSQSDYHINGFLGKGGMGIVMQARQTAIGRDVALKMILPSTSGSQTASNTRDQQKKFLYEAQVTGKLDHPNIVPVYELGTSNGILFYSMKKIEGTEWTHRIAEFTLEENLDVWMKVADAIGFSHQRQIIHRDLKPDNVMLGPFGEVLVTDWGCAVDLSLNEKFNGAGSPPWMAPEMATHRMEQIGSRSDIYLLGAILYQIIRGFPPHPGRTAMQVLQAAAKNQIIPVEDPDPLMQIALRATQTDPADRYSTVENMQAAIREYRRHSESIVLTERSEQTLEQAIESKDYERFSRALFGFQDALDLWPENSVASRGLEKARYAYGECALARKDYDLCLETLDRNQPDENSLYLRAEKAKIAEENKSKWLRFALRALAATILIGLAATSVAAGIAWLQRNEAIAQRQAAENARQDEQTARVAAEAARKEAEDAAVAEAKAREEAVNQRMVAEAATDRAKESAEEERKARELADSERMAADMARVAAEKAAIKEREAKEETERRTAQVELAGMQSNLALALSQVEQLDIGRASNLLDQLTREESYTSLASRDQLPKLRNWAWNRISLLSNRDLLQEPWGQSVSAVDYAAKAQRGVIATRNGNQGSLQIFRLEGNRMVPDPGRVLDLGDAEAESVLISEDGGQVVYALRADAGSSSVFRWNLEDGQTSSMNRVGRRSLQGFVVSDGAIIGGLNNGLWVWRNGGREAVEPERITNVQGRLLSIQVVDDEWVLVLAQMVSGERYPHFVSLKNPENRNYLRLQNALKPDRLSAAAYAQDRLIIGTESGRIFSIPFPLAEKQLELAKDDQAGFEIPASELVELPRHHFSQIGSIVVHDDGTLLSMAEEPLVNLWKPSETPSGYAHHIRLTGTPGNVVSAAFVSSSDHVMAVDEQARSIVWDALRQRQRRQVVRVSAEDGQLVNYDAPVTAIISCEGQPHAVSILENGRVDRWNTQTGEGLHQSRIPLAHVGHDPNSRFVDMAIDEKAGILVTSARLAPSLATSQAQDENGDGATGDGARSEWEFVKWDLNQLRMQDRWTSQSSEGQEVSLSGSGKYVLYGSDSFTRFREPNSRSQWEFFRPDFGSFFGVAHPKSKNLMMLVKLNGVVMMLDTDNLDASWKRSGYQLSQSDFFRLATKGDRPIIGRWSPEGDAFFVVWDSGRVTEVLWREERLSLGRDLSDPQDRIDLTIQGGESDSDSQVQDATAVRLGSRWNVDMAVRSQDGFHTVYVLTRFPGATGWTRLTRIAFPKLEGQPIRDQIESAMGSMPVALSDEDIPRIEVAPFRELEARIPNLRGRIVGSRVIGDHSYVATRDGTVYRVSSQGVQVYGRPKLLSAAGDRSGDIIVTLHEGGVLWRGDWTGSDWSWRQLEMQAADTEKISLSPDGSTLWIRGFEGSLLASAETGVPIDHQPELASSLVAAWQPNADATLLAASPDGRIRRFNGMDSREIGKLSGRQIKSLHFFSEAWNSPKKEKVDWLAIHCQSGDGLSNHELVYVQANAQAWEEVVLQLPDAVTKIACSPNEGLIAIGGQGTVGVLFAAPSLGEPGKQLFSLQGHAGSEICGLQFSHDGKTLISADRSHRMFSWLSDDALQGMTEQVSLATMSSDLRTGDAKSLAATDLD
jgi:serine/threonine protein kinase/WD40 repeat protein